MGGISRQITAGGIFLAVAACGGTTAAQHATGSPANTRVCEHYRTQRAFVQHDATPTLADVTKVLGWIAADVAQVTPGTPLDRDLTRMLAAMQGGSGSTRTASRRVFADCEALGVKFTR